MGFNLQPRNVKDWNFITDFSFIRLLSLLSYTLRHVHRNFLLDRNTSMYITTLNNYIQSGFGGLEVSVLASGTLVQTRPKPSDFSGEKILTAPSFGGEVKPSVRCRKFTACKRTQKWRGSRHFRQNSRKFLAHSSTFRYWGSLASFQSLGTPCGGSWNVLITGPPGWGFDVPLATALCKNLPAEYTQR